MGRSYGGGAGCAYPVPMTNPNDPYNRPTDQFGRPIQPDQPTEGYYTSDPYEAYGSAPPPDATPPNSTVAYPTYGYDPNQPPQNPTQAYPTYQGQGYPGEVQPLEQMPPGKPKRTGMWIAIAGAVALLLVGGVAVALLSGNSESDPSTASGTSTRMFTVTPIPRPTGTKIPPTSGFPLPSGIPGIIEGLGAAMGTISANDGSTLTLDGFDGKPVTVYTNDQTQVVSLTGSTVADLKVGDTVVAQGEQASDGSFTAKVIVSTSLKIGGFGN